MFSKENRLQADWLIDKIKRRGIRIQNQFFRLQIGKKGGKETRFAVIVSLKVSKLATKRNYLKRKIRTACQKLLPRFKTGNNIVISASPRSLQLSQQEIQQELTNLLYQKGYLK